MKGAEYIASTLAAYGAYDAFGIPGGVVLDLLYALNETDGTVPHLSYHEQCAGFAACGYAQASGRLGVAYATRGPGFTNLLTPMADAFYDSLPILFLTAHAGSCPPKGMRILNDQEMDTCAMVKDITKFAARVDSSEELPVVLDNACRLALSGRKGPVFLDVKASLLSVETRAGQCEEQQRDVEPTVNVESCARQLVEEISSAKRPVVLVGDGIDRIVSGNLLRSFSETAGLPFLSSRFSHDVLSDSPRYYGYVGSHGIRAANFILSKADLIVALGNRLNFPPGSESFSKLAKKVRIIRYEIDEAEFARSMPNSREVCLDVNLLLNALATQRHVFYQFDEWISVCDRLRAELAGTDVNVAVEKLRAFLDSVSDETIVVGDVGNCEFWLSRASVLPGRRHRTLYSKSFGALGCGIGKAIGAYYATRKPVACVVGDQGLMMNLQELHYVAQHRLPITIVLLDNRASGMIRDSEKRRFDRLLHVTAEDGFSTPEWHRVFEAFGNLDYQIIDVPRDLSLSPTLPRGNLVQNLSPELKSEVFNRLNQL